MKALFLLFFSQGLYANSLLETQTASGIANTLQGTAQGNPQALLNNVKENVNNYEQKQEERLSNIEVNSHPNPEELEVQERSIQSQQNNPLDSAPPLSNEERDQIQEINHSPEAIVNVPPPDSPPSTHSNFPEPAPPTNQEPNPFDTQNQSQITNEFQKNEVPTEEYFEADKIIEIEKPIDYKLGTQIFYKKDCLPSEKNCKRSGPVFTNIKSVIFDYAHSRGSFSKNKDNESNN